MKMNDKGLSLLEVLIVVVILAIITGGVTLGLSALLSKPADECANKLASTLQSARITTMGKQGLEMELYMQNECVYLREKVTKGIGAAAETDTTVTRISEKGVKLQYKWSAGSGYVDLGGVTPLKIEFDRSTGGLKKNPTTNDYISSFKISKGSRILTIDIAYLTGQVTLTD